MDPSVFTVVITVFVSSQSLDPSSFGVAVLAASALSLDTFAAPIGCGSERHICEHRHCDISLPAKHRAATEQLYASPFNSCDRLVGLTHLACLPCCFGASLYVELLELVERPAQHAHPTQSLRWRWGNMYVRGQRHTCSPSHAPSGIAPSLLSRRPCTRAN